MAANGASVPVRIKILEQNLHSMHKELHEIKRQYSTDAAGDRRPASSSKPKRKKSRASFDSEDSDNSSEAEIVMPARIRSSLH